MPEQLRLFEEEPEPESSEAETARRDFEQEVDELLEEMKNIAFKILVWGPSTSSKSPVAEKRKRIWEKLNEAKHKCWMSEEIKDPPEGVSLKAYEFAQAKRVDLIVMLVETDARGVNGEMHDFCSRQELLPKILLFYPEGMRSSYGGQGLVKDLDKGFRIVQWYTEIDISSCRVMTVVLEWVQARRSYTYSNVPVTSGG